MKKLYFLALLVQFSCSDKARMQEFDTAEIIKTIVLPKTINETSGLEFYNNNFITHNDSGDGPSLYVFNESGSLIETIDLSKDSNFEIENNDWEDVSSDDKYLFVADTGNNFGNRSNLNIIRVSKEDNYTVDGKIDAVFKHDDGVLLVDWKTNKKIDSKHKQQIENTF